LSESHKREEILKENVHELPLPPPGLFQRPGHPRMAIIQAKGVGKKVAADN
jgi:hypothetical protein